MSGNDFDHRYRLLKIVGRADGMRTHNAQELTTGRVVMVHVMDDAGPDAVEVLGRQLARLPDADKARVLETATLPAGYAVVTEFLPGLQSFPAWIAERTGARDGVADAVAEGAEPPQAVEFRSGSPGAPGEFTRLFMAGGRVNLETSPSADVVASRPAALP
ncbi:MAG TPA: hypothetical protein VGD56_21425, partial [Gemmatirosa sp.]